MSLNNHLRDVQVHMIPLCT